MLVLQQVEGDVIYIGQDIAIYFLMIRGRQAKIGVEARGEFKILRKEHMKKLETKQKAV